MLVGNALQMVLQKTFKNIVAKEEIAHRDFQILDKICSMSSAVDLLQICCILVGNALQMVFTVWLLTLSLIQTLSDTSEADNPSKHCVKRRNCS